MRKDTAGITHRTTVVSTLNNVQLKRRINLENMICRHLNHIELETSWPIVDIDPGETAFMADAELLSIVSPAGLAMLRRLYPNTKECPDCGRECDKMMVDAHGSDCCEHCYKNRF